MKLGFFGDSFCSNIQNDHSIENNYQTYIQKLAQRYNATIDNVGVGGSSVWDLVLLQWDATALPDVCIFAWTGHERLFHRDCRYVTPSAIDNNYLPQNLISPTKDYYTHFYDEEKHNLEYQSLLFYFDNKVLSKYPNTKFIHLWSFDDDYLHRWGNGVEIRPALETISIRELGKFSNLDKRANHIAGEHDNQLVCDSISVAIDNYQNGSLLSFL
jgi:hypothetical protein|tara:strand:- start:35 stop:676 length:642 start_codon:yes stop_codon:yes gene_type:complete